MYFIIESWQLKQRQSLPLGAKILLSQEKIKEWYEYFNGQVYISFSGGKDSTVLLELIRQLYPDIPGMFIDTGLEYPEIRQFVKSKDNIIWIKPKMTFKQVIDKYGYPVISKDIAGYIHDYCTGKTEKQKLRINMVPKKWQYLKNAPFKISKECCKILKINPVKKYEKKSGRYGYLGVMAGDSNRRKRDYLKTGCNIFDAKRPISKPLGFWTEQDILEYLYKYKIPYCSIYGDIIKNDENKFITTGEIRTGCMWCMFGVQLKSNNLNRFQRMKITHPAQYNYCINKLGLGKILDYIGVKY